MSHCQTGVTHYQWEGPLEGPVVVLVHGATVPMWVWNRLAADLAEGGFRVLRYDKFGRGYSDRPDLRYNRNLYRKQLLELVDKLGLKKPFDLVGLSLGGATAVNFTSNLSRSGPQACIDRAGDHRSQRANALSSPGLGGICRTLDWDKVYYQSF